MYTGEDCQTLQMLIIGLPSQEQVWGWLRSEDTSYDNLPFWRRDLPSEELKGISGNCQQEKGFKTRETG